LILQVDDEVQSRRSWNLKFRIPDRRATTTFVEPHFLCVTYRVIRAERCSLLKSQI